MNLRNAELLLVPDPVKNGFSFYLRERIFNKDAYYLALPLVFEERESDGMGIDPFVTLPKDTVQKLMDELWRNGFRPDKYEADAGALEQARFHLDDLRTILFNQLGIEKGTK